MHLINRSMLSAWFVLIGATMGSYWIGFEEADGASTLFPWFSSGLIVLAVFKMRLIGLYFMELRHAPLALRLPFELWLLVVCAGTLALYHFPPAA